MKCPFCGHDDTQVKDSRPSDDGKTIRRRRECESCGRRFTTFEKFQVQQVVVTKRDGRRELFDRDKLTKSLLTALRKRPVPQTEIARMVNEIEQQLTEHGKSEVGSREVGQAVLEHLQKVDFIGFIRYASVYNEFNNPEDFLRLIDKAR
ncbi:MAG: transcriptional repressor NrdR [Pseudomonadaceae bacterium]|nr:transcriptional repressor NrdR [Pseudomonadaceae bacterium]